MKVDGSAFTAGVWQPLFSKYRGPPAAGVDARHEGAPTADDALTVAAPYFLVADTLLTVTAGLARGSQGIREPAQRCVGPSIAVAVVNTMALVLLVLFRPLTSRPKLAVSVFSDAATEQQRLTAADRVASDSMEVPLHGHCDVGIVARPFLLSPSASPPSLSAAAALSPENALVASAPAPAPHPPDSSAQQSIPREASGFAHTIPLIVIDDTLEGPSRTRHQASTAQAGVALADSERDPYTSLHARAIHRTAQHQQLYDGLEGLLAGRRSSGNDVGIAVTAVGPDAAEHEEFEL